MAKSKSRQTPLSNFFPIGLFTVSYQPIFPKGAKTEIRDDAGKLIYNMKTKSSIKPLIVFSKEQIDRVVDSLRTQGYKRVKKEELSMDLPRICPRCKNKGSPRIAIWKKTYTPKHEKLNQEEKAKLFTTHLVFGHSTTKPETCNIGKISVKPNNIRIDFVDGLSTDSFGYSQRFRNYSLQ